MIVKAEGRPGAAKLDILREKIHSKEYLSDAIQRIALILSNELLDMSRGGIINERKRK
ncbi:MAG: hypothetical protein LBS06_05685 [Treponema sp.]|jgi:hypothetical protein|nr:hypothetical protein [Treponema sp.]